MTFAPFIMPGFCVQGNETATLKLSLLCYFYGDWTQVISMYSQAKIMRNDVWHWYYSRSCSDVPLREFWGEKREKKMKLSFNIDTFFSDNKGIKKSTIDIALGKGMGKSLWKEIQCYYLWSESFKNGPDFCSSYYFIFNNSF